MLALLFFPTMLMGSTLPILTAYLVSRSRSVGNSVGLLYCVNTLGSATACFACALGLMRFAGMQGAVTLAAAINLTIGGAALAATWRSPGRGGATPATGQAAAGHIWPERGIRLGLAVALGAAVGYLSLSYEILWFRAFSLANNTAGAFAIILGTVLAGIANGSLRVRPLFARPLSAGRIALTAATALLGASIIGLLLLPVTAASARAGFGYLYPMLLLVFVQSSLLGGLFPIICHWSIAADDRSGTRVSHIYLGNILGSVAGTLLTGFVLLDHLALGSIALLLAEIGVATAAVVAMLSLTRPGPRLAVAGGVIAVGAVLALPGTSLFGQVYAALTYKAAPQPGEEFTEIVENKSGIVTVSRNAVVFGGGAYDGMIALDMLDDPNLLIRPLSLSLFHPDPQEVLMIGLATGAWAQVLANHPAVKHLTIVEINPGYLPIIERHADVAGLLRNPRVSIVIDDGRRWLNRHPDARFDAIVQNTTWNYRANVTNLLSREYLDILAKHLRPDGVALYNTTGSLRAQRTACDAFADGYREINVMVAGTQKLRIDHDRLRAVLSGYRIDGHPVFDSADPRYRARLAQILAQLDPASQPASPGQAVLEPCRSIIARAGSLPPITDDNMGEEWGFIQSDPLVDLVHRAIGLRG